MNFRFDVNDIRLLDEVVQIYAEKVDGISLNRSDILRILIRKEHREKCRKREEQ